MNRKHFISRILMALCSIPICREAIGAWTPEIKGLGYKMYPAVKVSNMRFVPALSDPTKLRAIETQEFLVWDHSYRNDTIKARRDFADEQMIGIASQMENIVNAAIKAGVPNGVRISYRNILDSQINPEGKIGFFRLVTRQPEEGQTVA